MHWCGLYSPWAVEVEQGIRMASSFTCSRCGQRSPVRVPKESECAQCRSGSAWKRWDRQDDKLTIDTADIERAEKLRRRHRRAGRLRVLTGYALPICSLAASGVAAFRLWLLHGSWPVMDPAVLASTLEQTAAQAAWAGGGGMVLAAAGVAWRRHRGLFRSIPLLALNSAALLAAVAGLASALLSLSPATLPSQWMYSAMPALDENSEAPGPAARAQRATALIMAPDEDGDFLRAAVGAGVVVGATPGRVQVVTCSHVAMPYLPPGAVRKPEDAHPVWVALANGAKGIGRVRWCAPPPVDVVLVELEVIGDLPDAVPIAPSTDYLLPGTPVLAVPNPLRDGWKTLVGAVVEQVTRRTPAGLFRLVFSDLPVVPGDSGSGLYDDQGRLIGVNTWMWKTPLVHQAISLPSETMQAIVEAAGDL